MVWVHNRVLGGARAVVCTSVWIAWRALALAFVLVPSAPAGSLSIGESGTASYSATISVPPGIAGMVPSIGLQYSGGGVNGPLGHGWSIQGISVITRCPATRAIDTAPRGVDYSGADKLCLDGQRLIQTGATGAALNFPQSNDSLGLTSGVREYRTEKDSFARIRAYSASGGAAANGPAYFKVWTKSGQIYEYGNNANTSANAAINAQGKTVIAAWAVSRISDTLGNYIDFQYEQRDVAWGSGPSTGPSFGHEWNLLEIRYTGTPTQQPVNRVVFEYANRPDTPALGQDRSEAYHQGSKNVGVRRLNAVRTFINWPGNVPPPVPSTAIKVKTYKLTYGQNPVTRRSRLTQIRECAGAAETQCLPPVTLEYSDGGNEAYTPSASFNLQTLVMLAGNYGVITGNFIGSGRTDIIRWSDNPAENQFYKSNGDGSFTQVPNGTGAGQFNITDQKLFAASGGCFFSVVADFNGDGLSDILRHSAFQNVDSDVLCPNQDYNYLYISKGDGSFTRNVVVGAILNRQQSRQTSDCLVTPGPNGGCLEPGDKRGWTPGKNFYLVDVDGDGRLDVVSSHLPNVSPVLGPPPDPCIGSTTCTMFFKGDGSGNFTQKPTNLADKATYRKPTTGYSLGEPTATVDLNGDGLSDLVGLGNPWLFTGSSWLSRGDGDFDVATGGATCAGAVNALDFNGDGRADCLRLGTPGVTPTELWVADGTGTQPVSSFNLTSTGQELVGSGVGISISDIDADGRTDIVRWKDDPAQNVVYLSNGDGKFRASSSFNLNSAERQLRKSDGTFDFMMADFTGRGNAEILRLKSAPTGSAEGSTNQLYVKSDPAQPDQLLSVISPTGMKTALTWVPLSNSTSGSLGLRYSSDRGTGNAAVFPKVDLNFPMQVVATSVADSGVGTGRITTEYSYAGLKAAHNGRGGQGFRETRRQAPAPDGTPLTVVTQYLHDHPYTGAASKTETYLGSLNALPANPLSRSSFTYCEKAASDSQGTATPTAPCAVAPTTKIQRPYLYKQVDEGSELPANGGATLPKVTTTTAYNNSGNPTDIEVTTEGTALGISQTVTKTTTNIYNPDDTAGDNWILGRLQSATQRVIVPDSLGSIATNAGSAPLASATQGSAPGITLSTPSFPNTLVGSTVTASATLSNSGSVSGWVTPPTSSSVTGAGFSFVSTTCTSSLAGGANCTVTVRFSPTAGGTRTGSLAVATEAGTKTVTLTATGVLPAALALGGCSSNSPTTAPTAASMTCTLSNSGGAATSISYSAITGATVSGPTGACAAGATCGTVTVTTATTPGTYSGTLTATPNTGTAAATVVSLLVRTPAALALTGCNSTSPTITPTAASTSCTLSNTGQTGVTSISYSAISGATVSGPTSACSGGATCGTVTVTTGTAAGTYSGTLTATPNTGSAATRTVNLVVNAAALPALSGSPPTLAFGVVPKGSDATLTLTLTNSGPGVANGLGFAIGYTSGTTAQGSYQTVGGTCVSGGSIQASSTCTVLVRYLASCTSAGPRNGTFTTSGSNFASVVTTLTASTASDACN